MQEFQDISWDNLMPTLTRWHESKEHAIGERVFAFIEAELRAMIPAMIKRSWQEGDIEDVLQERLVNLIERPLQGADEIPNPRAYFKTMLRRDFINGHRSRKRRAKNEHSHETKDELTPSTPVTPPQSLDQNKTQAHFKIALARISVRERVLFKLLVTPDWLDVQEMDWLAERYGKSVPETSEAISDAEGDTYALSKVFDPGDDDPDDKKIRRSRMERFRKARERARNSLTDELSNLEERK